MSNLLLQLFVFAKRNVTMSVCPCFVVLKAVNLSKGNKKSLRLASTESAVLIIMCLTK